MTDMVPRWLAVAAGGDTVTLLPIDGVGPDFFVKANEYDALRARVSELEAAGRAVLNCNDQVCAFGHGGCPAQCRADEMLRKAIRCAGNKEGSRE